MRVEIINTGTELMLGGTVNTHLAFIARELFPLGLRVQRQVTVPDGEAIRDALRDTFSKADIVLVTGGLGPTTDDITRDIVADLLGLKLEHDEEIWLAIQERFRRRALKMSERIRLQALRPREATVLWNPSCERFIFVDKGRLTHAPSWQALVADERVRAYLGRLVETEAGPVGPAPTSRREGSAAGWEQP